MTVNVENKVETNIAQDKVDISVVPQKIDTHKAQQTEEKKTEVQDGTQEDPNFRAFREARKKDRADREAAERRAMEKEAEATALKAALDAAFSKSAPTPQAYQQFHGLDHTEESEDERIEKKVQAALSQREAAAERARIEREQREYPERLARTYNDFHQTIAQENLDYLDYHYPEVSRPLQRLHDGYDKWSDIYAAIKKFVPNNTHAKRDAAKADANFNKPRSISSTSITQPGEVKTAHILTEEKRASNWERMQKTLKGLS